MQMKAILILIISLSGLPLKHEEPQSKKFVVLAEYRNKIEVYEIESTSQKEAEKEILWLHSGAKVVK